MGHGARHAVPISPRAQLKALPDSTDFSGSSLCLLFCFIAIRQGLTPDRVHQQYLGGGVGRIRRIGRIGRMCEGLWLAWGIMQGQWPSGPRGHKPTGHGMPCPYQPEPHSSSLTPRLFLEVFQKDMLFSAQVIYESSGTIRTVFGRKTHVIPLRRQTCQFFSEYRH